MNPRIGFLGNWRIMKRVSITFLVSIFSMSFAILELSAEMEERDRIYLYDEHTFPPDEAGMVLIALTYVVSGKEGEEKGLERVELEIISMVLERYELHDKAKGADKYWIAILIYPGPKSPCRLIQFELDMEEFDEILFGTRTGT
jgi:hypothetical protein